MLRDGNDDFVLSGLAGTGKTTTLVQIVQDLKDAGRRPAVCAPTGKAVSVINGKQSVFRAKTLHSLLTTQPHSHLKAALERLDEIELLRGDGKNKLPPEVIEEEKKLLNYLDENRRRRTLGKLSFDPIEPEKFTSEFDCLVVDESSMVGLNETYTPFIAHIPVPKLFIGDKAQLPPVNDVMAIPLERPDVELTKILRQQADSGILKYAHMLHAGKVMSSKDVAKYPDLKTVKSLSPSALEPYLTDHQVVCWTNKERMALNQRAREVRGIQFDKRGNHLPVPGEYLVVDVNSDPDRLTRGDLILVKRVITYMGDDDVPADKPVLRNRTDMNPYLAILEIVDPSGRERELTVCIADMFDRAPGKKPPYGLSERTDRDMYYSAIYKGIRVQFSYAVTCHKAQGSEWDKVLYIGSMVPHNKEDWRKHWYTGCTRARSNLVVASYYYVHE